MSLRYKLTLAYDGSRFAGFQIQTAKQRTVQGDLEAALTEIAQGQPVKVHGSGRTDSGVHALGQVAHLDFPFDLDPQAMERALNSTLKDDVSIIQVDRVAEDFHARYDAKAKTYIYRIHNHPIRNPLSRAYTYWHPYALDEDRLKQALSRLEGRHDFTSFTSTKSPIENKVRTLFEARVSRSTSEPEWILSFTANGFLYHMVRVMVGTLLEIGDGRKAPQEIDRLFEVMDRNEAGPTAQAHGLYLKEVHY